MMKIAVTEPFDFYGYKIEMREGIRFMRYDGAIDLGVAAEVYSEQRGVITYACVERRSWNVKPWLVRHGDGSKSYFKNFRRAMRRFFSEIEKAELRYQPVTARLRLL